MTRLKKDEFYVVAVNLAAGTYRAEKWRIDEMWSNENPGGVRWSAVYPHCMVWEFNRMRETLKDVRMFCEQLDRKGFYGTICTD